MPNALALAGIAMVVDLIPLVGVFILLALTVLAALLVSPLTALIVLGLLLAYQQFEDRLLVPGVYGATLRLRRRWRWCWPCSLERRCSASWAHSWRCRWPLRPAWWWSISPTSSASPHPPRRPKFDPPDTRPPSPPTAMGRPGANVLQRAPGAGQQPDKRPPHEYVGVTGSHSGTSAYR